MWNKIYNVLSFILLVLFMIFSFYLLHMFYITCKVEKNFLIAIKSYISWLYLYISSLSYFLIKHGNIIYIICFFITIVLVLFKKLKNLSYSLPYLFYFCYNKIIFNIIRIIINPLVDKIKEDYVSKLMISFNYTTIGIFIHLSNFIVFILLVNYSTKIVKKTFIER